MRMKLLSGQNGHSAMEHGLKVMLLLTLSLCGCGVKTPVNTSSSNQERPETRTEVKPSFTGWGSSESEVQNKQKILWLEAEYDAFTVMINLGRRRFRMQEHGSLSDSDLKELKKAIDALEKNSQDRDRVDRLFYFARLCQYNYELGMGPGNSTYPYIQVFDAAFWDICERIAQVPGKVVPGVLSALGKPLSGVEKIECRN